MTGLLIESPEPVPEPDTAPGVPRAKPFQLAHAPRCCSFASMAQTVPIPPPGFDELPVDEKVRYVEALWNRIAATPEAVGVPDWHRQILRERLADYRSNPKNSRSWDDIRDELLRDFADRKNSSGT